MDKFNYSPIKKVKEKYAAPKTAIPKAKFDASRFLLFDLKGFILDNTLNKGELADRAIKTRYLRTSADGQYVVLVSRNNKTRLIC